MNAMSDLRPDPALERKLARLRRGEAPRVLDLFSGAGGISLGFRKAGFDIEGALELDALAALTHATNFHRDADNFEAHARPRDMTKMDPQDLVGQLDLGPVEDAIDVLVGGPPCGPMPVWAAPSCVRWRTIPRPSGSIRAGTYICATSNMSGCCGRLRC